MLEEEEDNKSNKKIILASKSPRRRRILELLKVNFEVIEPIDINEKLLKNPIITVFHNSNLKAQNVYSRVIIDNLNYNNTLIAGFDTVVFFKNRYLGKPEDLSEAIEFLKLLSGKSHLVISGVAVIDSNSGKTIVDSQTTVVKFKVLQHEEIENYLRLEDVTDKAGAYDISGFPGVLIEKINGCFYNVAGLPVFKFINLLKRFNYKVL
ncbi:MAG: septum formation protein Maf [Actinobacteria bacterium]|nr:septum formation protein Maf [Actinomycetota bacterium]